MFSESDETDATIRPAPGEGLVAVIGSEPLVRRLIPTLDMSLGLGVARRGMNQAVR
jgi:hypothetical protein